MRGGATWTVRVTDGKPARDPLARHRRRRVAPATRDKLQAELAALARQAACTPRTFEIGALFAVKGEVLDSRRMLVAVAAVDDEAAAQARGARSSAVQRSSSRAGRAAARHRRGHRRARHRRAQRLASSGSSPGRRAWSSSRDVDNEGGGRETRRYFGKIYVTVDNAGSSRWSTRCPRTSCSPGLVPAEMSAVVAARGAQGAGGRGAQRAARQDRHAPPDRSLPPVLDAALPGLRRRRPRRRARHRRGHGHARRAARARRRRARRRRLLGDLRRPHRGQRARLGRRARRVAARHARRRRRRAQARWPPFARRRRRRARGVARDRPVDATAPCARGRKEAQVNFRWTTRRSTSPRSQTRAGVGALRDVEVLERGVSGRATRLRSSGDAGDQGDPRRARDPPRARRPQERACSCSTLARDAGGHVTRSQRRAAATATASACARSAPSAWPQRALLRRNPAAYYGAPHLRQLY